MRIKKNMQIICFTLEEVNDNFNEKLLKLTAENADRVILSLGYPSDILLSVGIANKEIIFYGNKILKKTRTHGYSPMSLVDLPMLINVPIFIFKDEKNGGHTILTDLIINDKNVLVSLDVGKGKDVEFNIIKTVFDKRKNSILWWINNGDLLYANKEKALDYLLSTPAPIAGAANNQEQKTAAVMTVKNFVNPRTSIK